MLKNAYLGAKIGFDTAANELSKVCPLSVHRSPRLQAADEEKNRTQLDLFKRFATSICLLAEIGLDTAGNGSFKIWDRPWASR